MSLTLVRKDACHLCDDAQAVLRTAGATFELADLSSRPDWYAAYRESIPVVLRDDTLILSWPFTADEVRQVLVHHEPSA